MNIKLTSDNRTIDATIVNFDDMFNADVDTLEFNSFWNKLYLIQVTAQAIAFVVNANNETEAIDYLIDYLEEHMPGLLMTEEREF
jgi:ribonuclease D